MSNNVTIARPYAKAVFNHALQNKELSAWSVLLQELAQCVLDPAATDFICNPASAIELQSELLLSIAAASKQDCAQQPVENFIRLLAANKRLLLLPGICIEFEKLRAEQEKIMTVNVSSFAALTPEQEKQLVQSLSERLQRQVVLDMSIDKSLLGGAVIRAGDLVIDGSVREKLTKLGTDLAA